MEADSTAGLGVYTGILAIDARAFGTHNTVEQHKLTEFLRDVVHQAATRADVPELLQNNVFHAFRGDGYLIGFDPDLCPAIVDRYSDALQSQLRSHHRELRSEEVELRIRASLHLGPLNTFNALLQDSPSGTCMVESGRMLDADSVRALLDNSDPRVTFVATVLSEEVMKQVVRAGHSSRRPSEFVAATVDVSAKEYSGTGYLRVPVPSGDLLKYGLLYGQPTESVPEGNSTDESDRSSIQNTNSFSGHAENVAQAGNVEGGFHNSSPRADNGGMSVSGRGNKVAGRDMHDVHQQFSGPFHTAGDSNFGPSSGRRADHHDDSAEG